MTLPELESMIAADMRLSISPVDERYWHNMGRVAVTLSGKRSDGGWSIDSYSETVANALLWTDRAHKWMVRGILSANRRVEAITIYKGGESVMVKVRGEEQRRWLTPRQIHAMQEVHEQQSLKV